MLKIVLTVYFVHKCIILKKVSDYIHSLIGVNDSMTKRTFLRFFTWYFSKTIKVHHVTTVIDCNVHISVLTDSTFIFITFWSRSFKQSLNFFFIFFFVSNQFSKNCYFSMNFKKFVIWKDFWAKKAEKSFINLQNFKKF